MALNQAGITAFLADGDGATVWLAIGDGPTAGDQTSNERVQLVMSAAAGVITVDTTPPLEYTGTPGAGATHGLYFSASTAGTFYGFEETAGDQAFNAAGEYQVTAATFTGSST